MSKNNTLLPDPTDEKWEMLLTIKNNTGLLLEASCADEPDWGWWYREMEYSKKPTSVKAGESIEAFGLRASAGTWTGYEGSCTWKLPDNKGLFTLYVDVPYSASNSSSLSQSGDFVIDGWKNLEKSGHRFVREITVSLLNSEKDSNDKADVDENTRRLWDLTMNNNETIQNWTKLKENVTEMVNFNPVSILPTQYLYPPTDIFVGRSAANDIAVKHWDSIADPIYAQYWQKKNYVDKYFSVEVYSINTNPRNTESVPRGARTITETSVEVSSSIKTTLESNLSIRSLLRGEACGLTAELEVTYGVKNVLEESTSKAERITRTVEIGAGDKDRMFVPWVLSRTVAIYRKKKDGTVALIGISEWADEIFDKVYEY